MAITRKKYAKLFDTTVGQIVVIRRRGDNGPELIFFFDPGLEGLDVCSCGFGFSDDEEGSDKADMAFDAVTENSAVEGVSGQIDAIKSLCEEDQ